MKKLLPSQVISPGKSSGPYSPESSVISTTSNSISLTKGYSEELFEIVSPWLFHYIYKSDQVGLPISLLFEDFLCLHFKTVINLKNWQLNNAIFKVISKKCRKCLVLKLTGAIMTVDNFKLLRGHLQSLTTLSIKDTMITVDEKCGKIICSFFSLTELDISGCKVDMKGFFLMAQSCKHLKSLICQDCRGVDDYCLSQLVQCIQRFRKLENFDLARTTSFSDTGLTSILTAGSSVITSLNISGCKKLDSFALVGLRNKMSVLVSLNISHNVNFGQSVFEWIGEGCKALKSLNLCSSPALYDGALTIIGQNCRLLERLNISKCMLISDLGIQGFMKEFKGKLLFLDISGNLECTGLTTEYLSAGASEMIEMKMNGVGSILNPGLQMFFANAKKLQYLEMGADLRAASGHRRSVLPHISDIMLTECKYSSLLSVRISGAVLVTDIGACALIRKCKSLHTLDISHCDKVTDVTLFALGRTSRELKCIDVSTCILIGDAGVRALCTGCTKLEDIQLNGIHQLRDSALAAIPALQHVEKLSLRNCVYITNNILVRIARACRSLRSLDISGLDLATEIVIKEVALHCPHIISLTAESCPIQEFKFASILKDTIPLVTNQLGRNRVQKRENTVIEYNKYVTSIKEKQRSCLVLSRFCRMIYHKYKYRELMNRREEAVLHISLIYSEFCRLKRQITVKRNLKKRRKAVIKIGIFFRKYWISYMLKRKKNMIEKELQAFSLIQRVYRGYKSRKKSAMKRKYRLMIQMRLKKISWSYLMLRSIRKIRKSIINIQSHMRRFISRLNYLCFLSAVCTLQYRLRLYITNNKDSKENMIRQIMMKNIQTSAANIIKKNWKNFKFNMEVVAFIRNCGLYVGTETEEFFWRASHIQRYFRGYWVRKNLYLGKVFVDGRYRGVNDIAIKIQAQFRKFSTRIKVLPILNERRKIYNRWKHVYFLKPRLVLGDILKKIQRRYRTRLYERLCAYAAVLIQKSYRGVLGRILYHRAFIEKLHTCANVIKSRIRIYTNKLRIITRGRREHMAAFKIQRTIKAKIFTVNVRARIQIASAQNLNVKTLIEKKRILEVKAQRLEFNRIVEENFIDRKALVIQKAYHKYKKFQKIKATALKNVKILHEMKIKNRERKRLEREKVKHSLKNRILNSTEGWMNPIINATTAVSDTVEEILHPVPLITEYETARITNAIFKYRSGSIEQQGIENIHLTLGKVEAITFSKLQALQKAILSPYYMPIEKDVTGSFGFELILWLKMGEGKTCLTDLTVQQKPERMSTKKIASRLIQYGIEGFTLAWNSGVHIEILGHRTMLQGKGGHAIGRVEVALNPEDCILYEKNGLTLVHDLKTFGYQTSIWMHTNNQIHADGLFNYDRIHAYAWSDNRILRIIEAYCLTEKDLVQLRQVYDTLERATFTDAFVIPEYVAPTIENLIKIVDDMKGKLAKQGGEDEDDDDDDDERKQFDNISTKEIFKSFGGHPDSLFYVFLTSSVSPKKKDCSDINFSEYVNLVCFICMLGKKDFSKFLFSCADVNTQYRLNREQFEAVVVLCAGDSLTNQSVWKTRFNKYMDKDTEIMNPIQFKKFIEEHPYVVWSLQQIQTGFVQNNLGAKYWLKKRMQFDVVAKNMVLAPLPLKK